LAEFVAHLERAFAITDAKSAETGDVTKGAMAKSIRRAWISVGAYGWRPSPKFSANGLEDWWGFRFRKFSCSFQNTIERDPALRDLATSFQKKWQKLNTFRLWIRR